LLQEECKKKSPQHGTPKALSARKVPAEEAPKESKQTSSRYSDDGSSYIIIFALYKIYQPWRRLDSQKE
jgi:hypothetical protein